MSINKTIKVDDARDAVAADDHNKSIGKQDDTDIPAIDKSHKQVEEDKLDAGDYEGRKNDPDIDGPQQDSQETDDVYVDTRASSGLPPAGKNVGDLNAHDLSRHDK